MDSPLSPASPATLNAKSPSSSLLPPSKMPSPMKSPLRTETREISLNKLPVPAQGSSYDDTIDWDEGPSSPFVSEVHTVEDKENLQAAMASQSTASSAPTELISRDADNVATEATPLASRHRTPFEIAEDETSTIRTSRTVVSTITSPTRPALSRASTHGSQDSISVTTRSSSHESVHTHRTASYGSGLGDLTLGDEHTVDDTCFSAFSEIPNADMTAFARLGQHSPGKLGLFAQTPRSQAFASPGTARTRLARSPSPTPRGKGARIPDYRDSSDTTNLLLDFTQQFEALTAQQHRQRSPTRSPHKQNVEPHLLSYLNNQRSPARPRTAAPSTPRSAGKNSLLNLLDFELPPAPTPRSIPSITVRELENLKSKFSSELSSLRATLSGREAEVEALKRAVGDAERRVGEAMETSREERSKREHAEKEREDWERRGREFEQVLRQVKQEVLASEKERAEMETRLEEAEERAREAESRACEAEARALAAATRVVTADATASPSEQAAAAANRPLFTAEQVQKQIDEKVHTLSTELHTIYKKKHVTKVAGLKKGFEAKTRERTAELQSRIEELERGNEELQARLDGTLSGVLPADLAARLGSHQDGGEAQKLQVEEQSALIERLKAELVGREEEMRVARDEFARVVGDLERERVEKSELVAAVDEMLALQANASTLDAGAGAGAAMDDFRKSVSSTLGSAAKPSGLRAPGGFGYAGSKMAAPGLARSVSGGKSRMMSNIERMAGGRGLE